MYWSGCKPLLLYVVDNNTPKHPSLVSEFEFRLFNISPTTSIHPEYKYYKQERRRNPLANKRQEDLNNLSNQLLEVFVADIFSKNKVKVEDAKSRITVAQKEKLKETIDQLKDQVEDFLQNRNTKKVVSNEENLEQSTSPLREKLKSKKQTEGE